jgi:hypothetical protein
VNKESLVNHYLKMKLLIKMNSKNPQLSSAVARESSTSSTQAAERESSTSTTQAVERESSTSTPQAVERGSSTSTPQAVERESSTSTLQANSLNEPSQATNQSNASPPTNYSGIRFSQVQYEVLHEEFREGYKPNAENMMRIGK